MSFGRTGVGDQCRGQVNNKYKKQNSTMNKQQRESSSLGGLFNSEEFGKFLDRNLPTDFPSDAFLSKDPLVPSFDKSVFKSKDSFSGLFASKDWEMKFAPMESKLPAATLPPLKAVPMKIEATVQPVAPEVTPDAPPSSLFASSDWLPNETLGGHVEVPYSKDIFGVAAEELSQDSVIKKEHDLTSVLPSVKSNWDNLFFSQLQLSPMPSPVASTPLEEPQEEEAKAQPVVEEAIAEESVPAPAPKPKKKRKRAPRKKPIPQVKEYVDPTDLDVLLGRGGKSNHHAGNKRYREEVKNLQSWYATVEDKNEKTDLSQMLVDYVHQYNGRFLEKDETGWYIVPNITARRKASQALREDNDPEKRAAKRQRFIKKKEAKEAAAQAAAALLAGV